MRFTFFKNTVFLFLPIMILLCFSCGSQNKDKDSKQGETIKIVADTTVLPAIYRMDHYLPLLENKNIGVVSNQTSVLIRDTDTLHLIDLLLSKDIDVQKIFAPEHGFRGASDAGEKIKDGVDAKTGLPIVSLYGKNKKPTPQQMEGIALMVFDIQDVGVRFYTYLSTLHYVMEACAEAQVPLLILDRPNPNGHYMDGPLMEQEYTSFLGLHPVPLVYGMTIGEYAQMINGEGWLTGKLFCDLTVIPMEYYTHQSSYSLPIRPSPNLPNDTAINLYPSLGLLEGTTLNAGRGTEMQFQIFGSPHLPKKSYPFAYTPAPNFGSKNPKFNGILCNGLDVRNTPRLDKVDLSWIVQAFHDYQKKEAFFNTTNFTAHAGTEKLQQQIEAGMTADEIRNSWKNDLILFKKIRKKYLLYR